MKRIIVSVTNDLVNDQRVHKVCSTLLEMDYDIVLIGRKLKNSQSIERPYTTIRLNLIFNKGFLFYAEYNIHLFFKLLFLKKDVLLSNDLDTLLPNYLISKLFKKKLVYDSHELFTEVPELIDRPFVRSFWLAIEKLILPNIKNNITVCKSIAKYYKFKYGADFSVIRNFPKKINSIKTGSFPFKIEIQKIILYQGALNIGRGLELIIDTMLFCQNTILVIIGSGDIEHALKKKVLDLKLSDKVKFIGKINPFELKKLTRLADLGLSLEEDICLSYRFALPNKLFDYIQSNVPVLTSDLPEMKNIVLKYKVGEIVKNRNPEKLASQIKILLKNTNYFSIEKFEYPKNELNWEKESEKLKNIYRNLK
ncbi:glycosyltransferase [Lutibacter citreus]|uniref:glycosyltransferase n=1 Tax=Lutibacter citreus TaxID=2138210 RepID=UPI001300BA48|nr:glycosyltransferase [Lutibacter citreus]